MLDAMLAGADGSMTASAPKPTAPPQRAMPVKRIVNEDHAMAGRA